MLRGGRNGAEMDWNSIVKKLVWDESKTPYFVKADKLTQSQARNELFVYSLFLALMFGFVSIYALADDRSREVTIPLGGTLYAFSIFCSAIVLGVAKNVTAARYCITAPVAVFVFTLGNLGGRSDPEQTNWYIYMALTAVWLLYSLRAVAVAKAFHRGPREAD